MGYGAYGLETRNITFEVQIKTSNKKEILEKTYAKLKFITYSLPTTTKKSLETGNVMRQYTERHGTTKGTHRFQNSM